MSEKPSRKFAVFGGYPLSSLQRLPIAMFLLTSEVRSGDQDSFCKRLETDPITTSVLKILLTGSKIKIVGVLQVCPTFGVPLIKRIFDHFTPGEFCPLDSKAGWMFEQHSNLEEKMKYYRPVY